MDPEGTLIEEPPPPPEPEHIPGRALPISHLPGAAITQLEIHSQVENLEIDSVETGTTNILGPRFFVHNFGPLTSATIRATTIQVANVIRQEINNGYLRLSPQSTMQVHTSAVTGDGWLSFVGGTGDDSVTFRVEGTVDSLMGITVNINSWQAWNTAHVLGTLDSTTAQYHRITGAGDGAWITSTSITYGDAKIYYNDLTVGTNWDELKRLKKMTEPEIKAHLLEQEKRHKEELERRRKHEEEMKLLRERAERAEARADQLLRMFLNQDQNKELTEKGQFHLYTQSGRVYRIKRGSHGNITLIDEKGNERTRYCSYARSDIGMGPKGEHMPASDGLLAQVLMLQANEEQFLKTANPTQLMTAEQIRQAAAVAPELARVAANAPEARVRQAAVAAGQRIRG